MRFFFFIPEFKSLPQSCVFLLILWENQSMPGENLFPPSLLMPR